MQLDLLYISFKCGARRKLTQVARVRQASSILPDALVRDLWSRTVHETECIKEYYETGFMCAASVNRSSVRRRAERSEYEKHSETRAVCAVF